MQKIYICRLRLCDYLTFSSSIGYANVGDVTYAVYKPQPYLHNYPLMYGFAGLLYVTLASPTIEVKEIDYSKLDDVEERVYVYPARPRRISLRRMLLNIKGEGAAGVVQPRPKSMYPWHVIHLYLAPGSEFETVVVVRSSNVRIPDVVRIGVKRQGVFRVTCEEAVIKGHDSGLTDPVNLGDLIRRRLTPKSYIVLLETKTVRKGVPRSNTVVRAYFDEKLVAIVESQSGIRFRVPIIDAHH